MTARDNRAPVRAVDPERGPGAAAVSTPGSVMNQLSWIDPYTVTQESPVTGDGCAIDSLGQRQSAVKRRLGADSPRFGHAAWTPVGSLAVGTEFSE